MTKRSKSKAKARGGVQPALPGLEPSPAWQKLKAAPKKEKRQKVRHVDAGPGHPSWRNQVIPGKCTCADQIFEDNGVRGITVHGSIAKGEYTVMRETPNPEGMKQNPWIVGHAYWCSMWIAKCEWCGHSSGTHDRECQFWKQHPNLTPF